jgi:molybdate transport system substrate-binding protein
MGWTPISRKLVSGFFRGRTGLGAVALCTLLGAARPVCAEDVQVAVAGNFAPTLSKLAERFKAATGHKLVQSSGATGQLFAQIVNGAPYQVFLSADAERPRDLEEKGLAVAGSRFVYAEGRLVLWSSTPKRVDERGAVLGRSDLTQVALADPRAAPYGAAAERVLRAKELWDVLSQSKKLVLGASITQAHQFVATGNADVGFVALAQVRAEDGSIPGSSWIVPKDLAGPIRQEAVLLTKGAESAAAREFLGFLRDDREARAIITHAGYEIPAGFAKRTPAEGTVHAGGGVSGKVRSLSGKAGAKPAAQPVPPPAQP